MRKLRRQQRATTSAQEAGTGLRWLCFGIGTYVAVAVTGVAIAAVSQDVRQLFGQLDQSQRIEDEMLALQSRLLLERSTLSSYQNVDEVAEQQLSMRFPDVVRPVTDEDAGGGTPAAEGQATGSNVQGGG